MVVSGLIRLAFFCLLVYIFFKVLKKLFAKPPPRRQEPGRGGPFGFSPSAAVDEMVQDPVCKVYLPKREAVSTVSEGQKVFFCSRECCQKFMAEKAGKVDG